MMNSCAVGSTNGAESGQSASVVKLVAFGDSTTAPRGSLPVYLDLLKRDLPKKGMEVAVINAGIPGNTTEAARKRFTKDVVDQHPDLVVIQFGINDSAIDVWKTPPAVEPRVAIEQFAGNLDYFIETLEQQKCKVILMTPNSLRWAPKTLELYGKAPFHPNDPDGFNVLLASYADRVRKIATARAIPLVDVYAAYQAYGTNNEQSIDDLLSDGMHPNARGHQLVADLLIKVLLEIKIPSPSPR